MTDQDRPETGVRIWDYDGERRHESEFVEYDDENLHRSTYGWCIWWALHAIHSGSEYTVLLDLLYAISHNEFDALEHKHDAMPELQTEMKLMQRAIDAAAEFWEYRDNRLDKKAQ